jgi:hypothetical protein
MVNVGLAICTANSHSTVLLSLEGNILHFRKQCIYSVHTTAEASSALTVAIALNSNALHSFGPSEWLRSHVAYSSHTREPWPHLYSIKISSTYSIIHTLTCRKTVCKQTYTTICITCVCISCTARACTLQAAGFTTYTH